MSVTVKVENLTIPTYDIGDPDKNPQFIENRVYQGSSGRVYPYPVVETLSDQCRDKSYRAVIIENEYIELTVLPELGGRIQYARDKTNNYDFVYRNDVIKPALVGLTGPWISGGIEFNWPQHHRPDTYLPVDFTIQDLSDGGKAVLCHDTDQIYGTQSTAEIALHPGTSLIEISVRLYNGTSLPQSFLWWANPAFAVNEHTKTVMPPDVTAVMDHGKRDVSRYPIATGTYYKHDYSQGVDISRYKNVPVPTSFMAAHSDYDFVGGYDFARQAGILHVADHHISPGKKQWTWGSGNFGQAWDRNLTDSNGPYVELMTGVFTDNQPDFTWLKPYEGKTFTQYFMPYKQVGLVKNATVHAMVNLEIGPQARLGAAGEKEGIEGQGLHAGQGRITVYATRVYPDARVQVVAADGSLLYEHVGRLGPNDVIRDQFETGGQEETNLTARVEDNQGTLLVAYHPQKRTTGKIPEPAQAADQPEKIANNDELLLTGLHLEQYRHATYRPDPYYLEGLKRDPGDARINNAYGRLLLRRGDFSGAENHFRKAIARLTWRNPQPYDSEAFYNLGLALTYQGRSSEAFDAFYKATWDDAQKERAFFYMACIMSRDENYSQSLEFLNQALTRNTDNIKARSLKAYVLRKLGRQDQAQEVIKQNLVLERFDFVSGYERVLAGGEASELAMLMRGSYQNYLQTARDYALFGAYDEALSLLEQTDQDKPLVLYYQGYYLHVLGRDDQAREVFYAAESAPSDYCFPNRLDDIAPLETSMRMIDGSKAPYYLGCLFYDKSLDERAISLWEHSRSLDPDFPTVHRNLAIAYGNKRHDLAAAEREIDAAFQINQDDARVFLERDQLHRLMGWNFATRLPDFEQYQGLVAKRDDLYIEYLTVLNQTGQYRLAYDLMEGRHFHPWEGGEGKITSQYRISLTLMAKDALGQGEWDQAVNLLERALTYPENLGEGKLEGQKDCDIHFYLGLARGGAGDRQGAEQEFRKATLGSGQVAESFYYNDQPAEMVLFQGLAHQALGEKGKANSCFYRLLDFGEQHLDDQVGKDYFAVSLPDFLTFDADYTLMNRVHCLYLIALAYIGLGQADKAEQYLRRVLDLDASHVQASLFLDELDSRKLILEGTK